MVSGVVYRLFGLVKLSKEHMEGRDEILAHGRRNSVGLPASEVYRPAVYRLRIYWLIVYQPEFTVLGSTGLESTGQRSTGQRSTDLEFTGQRSTQSLPA